MNMVTTEYGAGSNNLKVEHNSSIAPNVVNISGSVSKTNNIYIPVPNQKLYFKLRLEDAIRAKKLEYYSNFSEAHLPAKNVYLVHEVNHSLKEAMNNILKDSNNMTAETAVKIAGAVYSNDQGTMENSLKMLDNYINKLGLSASDIRIVDGSGVSKNNIMTADFMTKFLIAISKDDKYSESDSIDNQKRAIEQYVKEHNDFEIVNYYIDNGFSGANFDRPEFIRLCFDIAKNKINCVIVKDLSRFGRDSGWCKVYLSETFPEYNIRFISINDKLDNYDNPNFTDDLEFSLLNLVYEQYAVDISKKVSSVKHMQQERGDFIVKGY